MIIGHHIMRTLLLLAASLPLAANASGETQNLPEPLTPTNVGDLDPRVAEELRRVGESAGEIVVTATREPRDSLTTPASLTSHVVSSAFADSAALSR